MTFFCLGASLPNIFDGLQGYSMANIHSYETFGTVDGPGVRFVVFMQGCPLRCKYCHNRDTWDVNGGSIKDDANETFQKVLRYKHYYILGGGITITGGEPLLQSEYVKDLFSMCKKEGLHTALDTSGYILNESVKKALEVSDLVMLDIKSIDEKQHKWLTGVSSNPIIRFLEYLCKINKLTWARHVVIPGITFKDDLLHSLAKCIKKYPCIKKLDLLSYHTMGSYKWKSLGLSYPLEGVPPLSKEEERKAKQIFIDEGISLV